LHDSFSTRVNDANTEAHWEAEVFLIGGELDFSSLVLCHFGELIITSESCSCLLLQVVDVSLLCDGNRLGWLLLLCSLLDGNLDEIVI